MVRFPDGLQLEPLVKAHKRADFVSRQDAVDRWLQTQALQSQEKRLSITRVLVDRKATIAGFFSLAIGQVDMSELPKEIGRKLPRRLLPVAVLAWLGVERAHQGRGLGGRLLAQALSDCHAAGRTFPFVAVVIDCVDEDAKAFYGRWDFDEVPGRPMRLFLSTKKLDAMMAAPRT